MRRICVFLGSNYGTLPEYTEAARGLGRELARRGLGLVYGGACVGLMGELADAALGAGGEVTGVMPRALVDKELAHTGLTDLRVVETMHERKALMAELADGFVAMPGGLGTLEEIFEVLTWAQLGFHGKPCGLLDVRGYYRSLALFLDHITGQGFVMPAHREMILVDEDPGLLLERFARYRPVVRDKWALRPRGAA
ncbi:MAG: TIGR00730 family Rossman fold protein [Desulfovibrionaceae bacterium]|nr:TIGR00730 family Rossman fold protein [Desulfovibrionaceae bacterium]